MRPGAPKGWPEGVDPVSLEDLGRLCINRDNQLFWDGRRIEVKRRLDLSPLEKAAAVIVTVMAILGGLGGFATGFNDASEFLCVRNIHLLSCPAHPVDACQPPFC